jgi:hypothetical protein
MLIARHWSFPKPSVKIRNKLGLYSEELLAPRPTLKLEDPPVSSIRYSIYSQLPSSPCKFSKLQVCRPSCTLPSDFPIKILYAFFIPSHTEPQDTVLTGACVVSALQFSMAANLILLIIGN